MVTHAVTRHHRTGDLGCLFDIIRSPCRDRMEDQLLRRTTAGQCHDLVERLFPAHQEALIRLHLHRISKCPGGSRHNRDLVDRSRVRLQRRYQRMTDLMVGDNLLLIPGNTGILLLISGNNRLDTLFQILLGHGFSSHPYCPQRRLIDNVCQLRAARTVGGTGDLIVIHTLIHFNLFAMDFQNCLTAFQIRQLYRNPAVKTSRTKQSRIEGFRTVGRRQNDNTLLTVKTIHLSQKLVQRLLALVIAAHAGAVTLLTNRIDLVDKYDTRRFFIGLFK